LLADAPLACTRYANATFGWFITFGCTTDRPRALVIARLVNDGLLRVFGSEDGVLDVQAKPLAGVS
jgi:hypothetical protein